MGSQTVSVENTVIQAVEALDLERTAHAYREQNEFIFLDSFLPLPAVHRLLSEVDRVRSQVHRNYIPRHKKGGSVSYYVLVERAPTIVALYRSPALIDFLSRLAGTRLLPCPDRDPHACALYFYTEPGDHMGFHYDTSYYKGARYTLLLGLVQQSSSRLACQLYKDDPARESRELQLVTDPGSMVFFNGNKLYHSVTPLGKGEERIVLTMEYVTNPDMGRLKRLVSNMKDAIAYFGFAALIRRKPSRAVPA
jgi:alkylated DNA repair dioxygenase AlkB